MNNSITHKRGDTFEVQCTYTDSSGDPLSVDSITIDSKVKSRAGEELTVLTVTKSANIGEYTLRGEASSTQEWPIETLSWDIQYTEDSTVLSTETIFIQCELDVT